MLQPFPGLEEEAGTGSLVLDTGNEAALCLTVDTTMVEAGPYVKRNLTLQPCEGITLWYRVWQLVEEE